MSRKIIFNIVFYAVGGWFTWAAVGAATISAVGSYAASKSQKAPATASYTPVDVGKATGEAVQADTANLAGIQNLVGSSNAFTQQQANAMMEQAVPGYADFAKNLLATGQANLAQSQSGQLPPGVQQQLEQLAAEKGISVGGGGQFQGFSALSLLGTNMLNYGQQQFQNALSALTTVTGTAPRVNPASPMSMFVTPSQAIGVQTQNNQTQQEIQQGANNAQTAANNYGNMSSWMNLASQFSGSNNLAGVLGQLFNPNAGVGQSTSYTDFLKNNPNSSAAIGQQIPAGT